MARRWVERIRQTHQLTVFMDPKLPSGWQQPFRNAFIRFNLFAAARDLGVTLVPSSDRPNSRGGGANVMFTTFSSSDLHAVTIPARESKTNPDDPDLLVSQVIQVPDAPKTGPGGRGVGDGIMEIIAVHELIHATGLDDSDHTTGVSPDVFAPVWFIKAGSTPDDDQLELGGKLEPPIVFSPLTAAKIRTLWR
jgi:hypothetical protein